MAWLFIENEAASDAYIIEGENARHLSKSLRIRAGENLTLVSPSGEQLECEAVEITPETVTVKVLSRKKCVNEPETRATLYQALPKGDKMEYIIQKCVELGVDRIVPVLTARCISRPDGKALAKKRVRWQKIAREAAQQSRRGKIPVVEDMMTLAQAAEDSKRNACTIIFYELGGENARSLLSARPDSVGFFIGSEGGFEEAEAETVVNAGGKTATLGKRILRAETAPLAALSIIMYESGEFDNKD